MPPRPPITRGPGRASIGQLTSQFYAGLPDAEGFTVVVDGAVAAVCWARRELAAPGRWLDHASFAPDADPIRSAIAVPAGRVTR
jgi:hypothetical protein